ncbi:hypothetical protein DevBK_15145 [Devosia sp. BK]|uniref:tetratricopeptide repeat protein n=1 Tax=Devosia sp. BK TaxID=2871706 RepID=UPI0029399704|nr:tetratricopeptide repeat protein [Devosia sp. BK]MDV3252674.1 hypothetical protein [Devosia sp. BK]
MVAGLIRQVLAFVLLLSALAGPALAQPASPNNVSPQVDAATLQQLEARRQVLFKQMLANPANLDVSFEYAALSSQVGDLEGSIATLERMLIFAPGLPRLQLELGVLYFRLGALDTARSYFEAVAAQPGVPDDVRARIASYLNSIEGKATGQSLRGMVFIGTRYQTNANAAPGSRIVNLNGLDFVLNDAAVAGGDVNVTAGLNLGFSQGLGAQGDRFDAVLNVVGTLYAQRKELGTGVIELSAGPSIDLRRIGLDGASLGLYGIVGAAMLDSTPYLATAGVGAVVLAPLDDQTRVSLRGEYRREAYADTAKRPNASSRDGDRFRITAGVEHRLSEDVVLFASTSLERRAARVDFNSLWEASLQAGVNVQYESPIPSLPAPWSVTLAGTFATRLADGPDRLISTKAENGQDTSLTATNTIPLPNDFSMQAQVGYRWVTSNYDTRRFDNFTAGLTLQKKF